MDIYEKLNIQEDMEIFPTSIRFKHESLNKNGDIPRIAHAFENLFEGWYEHGLLATKPMGIEVKKNDQYIDINMVFEPTEFMIECSNKLQKKWHGK